MIRLEELQDAKCVRCGEDGAVLALKSVTLSTVEIVVVVMCEECASKVVEDFLRLER